jgi:aminopeptidase N
MIDGLARAITQDKFWGVRGEAANALAGISGDVARQALLAATKDPNARVRARAVTALGTSKDVTLATRYQELLNDQSYGVIRAAALALGQTKDPKAFDSLGKLLEIPSWRDTIKASALSGLEALGDKRAVDLALPYTAGPNYSQVRGAALKVLGSLGANDARAFPKIAELMKSAFQRNDFALLFPATEALVALGDPRGISVLEELAKDAEGLPPIRRTLMGAADRLKKVSASNAPKNTPPK